MNKEFGREIRMYEGKVYGCEASKYRLEHGTLLVRPLTVEKLYHDFSKDRYAIWLYVDDDVLEEFANWLDELDI